MKVKILKEFRDTRLPVGSGTASREQMLSAEHNTRVLSSDAVLFEEFVEDFEIIYSTPDNPNLEYCQIFYDGLAQNSNSEYLTMYTVEKLSQMYLVMPQDKTAGMGCDTNGHMGSGWNNGSRKGVLKSLMNYTKENFGGNSGDHFDGGLGGYYASLGLVEVYDILEWDPQYAPSDWAYKPIDVYNPKKSVYAPAMSDYKQNPTEAPQEKTELVVESGYKITTSPYNKIVQYSKGAPDVIYRRY
jgi:hypothetical protein